MGICLSLVDIGVVCVARNKDIVSRDAFLLKGHQRLYLLCLPVCHQSLVMINTIFLLGFPTFSLSGKSSFPLHMPTRIVKLPWQCSLTVCIYSVHFKEGLCKEILNGVWTGFMWLKVGWNRVINFCALRRQRTCFFNISSLWTFFCI
jgi:hypothetical protein